MEQSIEQAALIKKLRRVEDRFNFLIKNICDDFVEVNIYTGECWMTHSSNNMVSKNIYKEQIEWFAENIIVDEEREAYLLEFDLQNLLASLRRNHGFYKVTYTVMYPDGKHYLLIVSALIQDSLDPGYEYIVSYAQDITELRLHEEQNRKLADISKQLLEVSMHDAMTEIYNRAAAEKVIMEHLGQDDTSSPGTLLLIDVDYFKRINDCYGHGVGDQVLKFVSRSMREVFRTDDILCRWGGDEFLIFMRNVADSNVINSRMERLRWKVSAYQCEHQQISVTLSVGIVIAHEKSTLKELFKQADKVLYQVKNSGRNNYMIELHYKEKGFAKHAVS